MKHPDSDIAAVRRAQIVRAAESVITEQGIQNLSLSEIEARAGMSRGQLTYYFRTKETILLAVFDHVLEGICQKLQHPAGEFSDGVRGGWELTGRLLQAILREPLIREFVCLEYTFLAQISHREDFRERLARLYEEWRSNMAAGLERDREEGRAAGPAAPRAMASLIQAVLHGLAVQRLTDPGAVDPDELLTLSLDVFGTYMAVRADSPPPRPANLPPADGP